MPDALRFRPFLAALLLALGCRSAQISPGDGNTAEPGGAWIVRGARDVNQREVTFGVDGTHIVSLDDVPKPSSSIDLDGYYVVPAFIDSHVHLSYYAVADRLPLGGVVGAADFAAPLPSLALASPIFVVHAGPMLTPLGGYPTESWGRDGYGLELASSADAAAAVDRLLDAGASFVKAPLSGAAGLDDATLAAVALRAHERGARVALHALAAADAERAAASQADILAHTPADPLPASVIDAWGSRTVVSTLAAFGAGAASVENLRAFAARGALILYGTDLGNTRGVGIQAGEIAALIRAGLDGARIVNAATAAAADFWGFQELGRLEPGRRASFLVLDEDPNQNPLTLVTPRAVVFDGRVVAGSLP